jgi:hypothetical protein
MVGIIEVYCRLKYNLYHRRLVLIIRLNLAGSIIFSAQGVCSAMVYKSRLRGGQLTATFRNESLHVDLSKGKAL